MHNENLVDYKHLTDQDENDFVYLEQAGQPVTLIHRDMEMVARCATLTDEVRADPHVAQALRDAGMDWGVRCYALAYYTDRPDGEEIVVADRSNSGRALILTRTTRVSYGLRG